MSFSDVKYEALPWVLGTGEKGHLFQGNKDQHFGGNMETKTVLVTIGKNSFREQGNKPIYIRGIREQVPNPDTSKSVDEQQPGHVFLSTIVVKARWSVN